MSKPAEQLIRRHRLTVADYHRMGEAGILTEDQRVELIEGEIVDMSPMGSRHAGIVKLLNRILAQAVGDLAIVSIQDPVRLSDFSEPEPDIALLRPRPDFYVKSHPGPRDVLLLIEVADASVRYDRDVKLPLYARHGIAEVWLVDLEGGKITLHTQPEGERYLQSGTPADMTRVAIAELGVNLDLSGLL